AAPGRPEVHQHRRLQRFLQDFGLEVLGGDVEDVGKVGHGGFRLRCVGARWSRGAQLTSGCKVQLTLLRAKVRFGLHCVKRKLPLAPGPQDRKSTRLNSSHVKISYAVFCLKKKKHSVERERRVFDVDVDTPADVDAFTAGYISYDDDVIVGLKTEVKLKRAMMPSRGWRMVE